MAKNYYLILNITHDATQEQIKSAYRQKAKELHPDRYGDDREPFQSVQEAYAVLTDPAQRRAHDEALNRERRPKFVRRGSSEHRRAPKVEPLIPESRSGHFEDLTAPHSVFSDRGERRYHPSLDELFERVWSNFSAFDPPKAEHPENLTIEILLSPKEAHRGGRVRITLPVQQACPSCGGQGGLGPFDCLRCRGQGVLSGEFPVDIAYPAGISESYVAQHALDSLGIHNLYLTVYFRVSE